VYETNPKNKAVTQKIMGATINSFC